MSMPGEHSSWPPPDSVAEAMSLSSEALASAVARHRDPVTPPNPRLDAAGNIALLQQMTSPKTTSEGIDSASPSYQELAKRDAATLVLAGRIVNSFGREVHPPLNGVNDGQ